MKKLLTAIVIATSCTNANAVSAIKKNIQTSPTYNTYHQGYRNGKSDAYDNVAKTVFYIGTAVVAGVIIYQLGKQSRWGVNENGITYKF